MCEKKLDAQEVLRDGVLDYSVMDYLPARRQKEF
jgi:hypothetical protein